MRGCAEGKRVRVGCWGSETGEPSKLGFSRRLSKVRKHDVRSRLPRARTDCSEFVGWAIALPPSDARFGNTFTLE